MTPSKAAGVPPTTDSGRFAFAFRPIVDIGDRRAVAYEVLPRGRDGLSADSFGQQLLEAVPIVHPAVLIVPTDTLLVESVTGQLLERSGPAGVSRSEIVWLIEAERGVLGASVLALADSLVRQGYRVALDGVGLATLSHPELVGLLPAFAMTDHVLATELLQGQSGRATLAALLAYFGRLGSRVVGRGADDEQRARAMLEVGLKLATGTQLERPVVVDERAAEPGEAVVDRAWFRERSVSVLAHHDARTESPRVPLTSRPMPIPDDGVEADDRQFARALGAAARSLQAEHDPVRILETIAEILPTVVPVERLAIFEADWERYRLCPRIVMGEGLEGLGDFDDSLDNGITGWAFLRGDPYNCPDTYGHAEAAHVPGTEEGRFDESLLVIPLIAGDHQLGALDLWRDGLDRFTDEDVERCALFGYLAAAAWRNAQLYIELEHRAVTDTLTGLLNTRWWEELAPREAAQAQRAGTSIAVLLVDLDNFKNVNDTSGHSVGDRVLRNVARVLAADMRSGDAAVRFGGDEFLLLLHDADFAGANRVAEAIRTSLATLPPPADGVPVVTASIGIALFPQHGPALEEVVRAADRAMYQAKADGRDRVRMYAAD
jgi:diguanylate cyclase (GGDEF)-like protein